MAAGLGNPRAVGRERGVGLRRMLEAGASAGTALSARGLPGCLAHEYHPLYSAGTFIGNSP